MKADYSPSIFQWWIGFLLEVRDFYLALSNYNQKVNGNLQNNLAFTGGLLIRF